MLKRASDLSMIAVWSVLRGIETEKNLAVSILPPFLQTAHIGLQDELFSEQQFNFKQR